MRKICSVLAFFLLLAAVVPARAEGSQTVMTSEVSLPTLEETPVIDVRVPQSGRIVINPYGLPTQMNGETSTEQIISETMTIYNASEVPVAVSASAAGHITEASSMTFASAPPAAGTEEKQIFLYAEFQNEDGLWSGSYHAGENQLLIGQGASAAKETLTLDAGPSEGFFRMFGATSVDTADPWSVEDGVSVTFTFTFSPVEEPAPDQAPVSVQRAAEDIPAAGEMSATGETPAQEETPATGETPAAGETSSPEETPGV